MKKTNVRRRDFIKVLGVGGTAVLLPSALSGCSDRELLGLSPWHGPRNDMELRLKIISYGILAPNPHNKQPWKIQLKEGNKFDLFVDRGRLLPETDPFYRQIHIGQGTFLENIQIAAAHFGYHAKITYFPKGNYSNQAISHLPVVEVSLLKSSQTMDSSLFESILKRQSNKSVYKKINIKQDVFDKFSNCINEMGITFSYSKDDKQLEVLHKIMSEGMTIETGNHKRDMETIKMFRFNDQEVNKYRDGFGIAQTGKSGLVKKIVETLFLDRSSTEKDPSSFGKQAVTLTTDQANSASAYCWLLTDHNERIDQVLVGQVYNRINLIATKLGLAMHPMSQVLQEYKDMSHLQEKFLRELDIPKGKTVQMFFRLGKADPIEHSPRRKLKSLLV
ncbi:hypothetical protein A9Q84_11265 [Halobacteriovorax marinus]|uniref:Twin-arginine translocation pathway signal protein n=1 Tax=Halobacteriovorax marinus TaxID=97084 RepID=A0A1Y5F7K6_9BACT|nr:hypothetical protein A9Q84_11265 [Halobacteriovorax marinus]